MYAIYIGLIIIISVVALVGTIYAGKQTNRAEEVPVDSEHISSSSRGKKRNSSIKVLSYIYGITFLITAVIIAIFII
ncbi:hypothetical protein [Pontibacillus marinus]|uniref:Uncharacterized protein n=1 Tax=Pontibacillus marinus BH030004 = DSM 16465 TaxID=1385511 RepID=A0A0A5FVV1_9BACI|nr:hypothetical protein [Pontibacillus marinus]KGX84019.1 hypothetical protein N783_19515 [Pontibacillus marinus BH030004 = DSM 16465]